MSRDPRHPFFELEKRAILQDSRAIFLLVSAFRCYRQATESALRDADMAALKAGLERVADEYGSAE